MITMAIVAAFGALILAGYSVGMVRVAKTAIEENGAEIDRVQQYMDKIDDHVKTLRSNQTEDHTDITELFRYYNRDNG